MLIFLFLKSDIEKNSISDNYVYSIEHYKKVVLFPVKV